MFVPSGKTANARRHLPMSQRLVDTLSPLASNGSEWVFPSARREGKHIGVATLSKTFQRKRDALGMDKQIVLYIGRHTFATDYLDMTGDAAKLKKALGHSSIKTTDRYLHPSISNIGVVMDQINESRHNIGHSSTAIN